MEENLEDDVKELLKEYLVARQKYRQKNLN